MRRARGFTLIELVLALTILGTMLLLLYSGLSFALRSWDAGDVNGRLTMDRRIGANFLRRELSELFPMRWKDPTTLKLLACQQQHIIGQVIQIDRCKHICTRAIQVAQTRQHLHDSLDLGWRFHRGDAPGICREEHRAVLSHGPGPLHRPR